jgi:glycosyltransferase involved in cell wall biosynthesis
MTGHGTASHPRLADPANPQDGDGVGGDSVLHVVTPYGRDGPSSRVRVYEWLDRISSRRVISGYLSHRNASAAFIARHPAAAVTAEARLRWMVSVRPRRLLLHREASPLSRGTIERRLVRSADFAVYDLDDGLPWDWGQGGALRRLAPKAPKAQVAAAHADRVIAGSPVLAEWASTLNSDVVLIPSCVSPRSYAVKTNYQPADPPRLGWIGSPDNERYLGLIAPALWEVNRRTGARVTLIGTTTTTLGTLERLIDRVAWSEPVQRERLAGFDVGLAPLPDDAYSRGKCGYKLLQYAAAAVPAVGSPVGVNRAILSQLGTPAPEDLGEWVDAIMDLLGQPARARAALGARARRVVETSYSYDAWLPRWRQAVGLDGK